MATLAVGCVNDDGGSEPPPPTPASCSLRGHVEGSIVVDEEPDWCPSDASLLVFKHHAQSLDEARVRGWSQVWLLQISTRTRTYLTEGAMPSWAPDGSEIAFMRNSDDGAGQIWARVLATGEERQLTNGRTTRASPDWSPEGTRILYQSSGGEGEAAGLWILNLDDGGRRPIRAWGHAPTWSPTGARVATFGPGMYILGTDPSDSITTLIDAPPYIVGDGKWSPLGNEIAFHHLPVDEPRYLSVIDIETREITRLLRWGRQPTWSPDGKQLAFAALDSVSNTESLYRWDRNTRECERLTFVCDYYPPDSCYKFCEAVPERCEWAYDRER